jgi:hypothetical protein
LGRKRKEELLYNRYSILHNEKVLEMCCITKYLYLTLLYYTFKMAKMVNFITFDLSKREEAIKYIQKKISTATLFTKKNNLNGHQQNKIL